ncbi:YybH family protein [Panacagrimonas sp.]|uniref:YybH family protein n=1 Tax=Panacagrimonas sp. TaxID=2480088 RepID=UPI003B523A98
MRTERAPRRAFGWPWSSHGANGFGLILLVALVSLPPPVHAAGGGFDDPVATVNQFRGALQDGSVAQVLGLLAPDVLVFEAGEQQTSRDDYAAHHLKADIAFLAKVYVDTLGQNSRVDGNTAWVTTRSRLVSREADPRPPTTVTETIVLNRSPQGWRIAHIHWSSSVSP